MHAIKVKRKNGRIYKVIIDDKEISISNLSVEEGIDDIAKIKLEIPTNNYEIIDV